MLIPLTNAVWRFNQSNNLNQAVIGVDWTAPAYDDTQPSWQSGPSLIAGGEGNPLIVPLIKTTVNPPTLPAEGVSEHAYYFRVHFDWPYPSSNAFLHFRCRIDDNAAFYLNGIMIVNRGVNTPGDFSSLGRGAIDSAVDASIDEIFDVNQATLATLGFPLKTGENILAVEVHQVSSSSSDIVFGADVTGIIPFGPALVDRTEPTDRIVVQHRSSTLRTVADGYPNPTYQWWHDGVAIPAATSNAYTIVHMSAADAGQYYCQITNPDTFDVISTRTATVTYSTDTVGPILVRVAPSPSMTAVTVEFSEPLDAISATTKSNYTVTAGATGLNVTGATLVNESSVILTTARQTEDNQYTIRVDGVRDVAGNLIDPSPTSAQFRSYVAAGCNGVLFETFNTGAGNVVWALTSHPSYPNNPKEAFKISDFNTRDAYPDDGHDRYGGRLRGLFFPPVSGNWVFYLRSKGSSELWFNQNGAVAAGRTKVAEETSCCNSFMPVGDPRTSKPIPLIAGEFYYIEGLYKADTGADYCQVAAKLETAPVPANTESIPGSQLGVPGVPASVVGGVTITRQPSDQTKMQTDPVTFMVSASNGIGAPICYQWQRDDNGGSGFQDIPGATAASFTKALITIADDNGDKYRVVVSVAGLDSVTSDSATLTVTPDTVKPRLTRVVGTSMLGATVYFSEPIDSNTVRASVFAVDHNIQIDRATINPKNPTRIDLTISAGTPLTLGGSYVLTAYGTGLTGGSGLADTSANPLDPDPATRGFIAQNFAGDPDALVTLPTNTKLAVGSLTERGFDLRFVQTGTAVLSRVPPGNDNTVAEMILSGNWPGQVDNLAPIQCYVEPGIINYDREPAEMGSLRAPQWPDKPFPGFPTPTLAFAPLIDSFVMEALCYIELQPGVQRWIVNSDDGFRVTPATSAADPNNSTVLGEFNGDHPTADTRFDFYVTEAGLYPIRLLYEEGAGSANVEFMKGDLNNSSIKIPWNADDSAPVYRPPVPEIPPSLFVSHSAQGFSISWSAAAVGFCLESSISLAPPVTWTVVSQPPTLINGSGGRWTLNIAGPSNARFYRLHRL